MSKSNLTVKELIDIIKTLPQDYEIVKKKYVGDSDMWGPVSVKYVEASKLENKVLID